MEVKSNLNRTGEWRTVVCKALVWSEECVGESLFAVYIARLDDKHLLNSNRETLAHLTHLSKARGPLLSACVGINIYPSA